MIIISFLSFTGASSSSLRVILFTLNTNKIMQDKIKKTRSKKDLIISLVLLLAGVAMCFSSDSSVLICGIVFIMIGIAALIAMKTSFKIDGDDTIYQCQIINQPALRMDQTEAFLKGEAKTFEFIHGDGLMLYVYHNADNTKGYAQMKVFSDYDWIEHGELYKLDANQISQLLSA